MKKSLIFVLIFSLLCSACGVGNRNLEKDLNEIEGLTGLMTEIPQEILDEIFEKDPNWRVYKVKELQKEDVIQIGDVVENCNIQTGKIAYLSEWPYPDGGYDAILLAHRKIKALNKQGYIWGRDFKYGSDKRGYSPIGDQNFLTFFEKNHLRDHHLVELISPEYYKNPPFFEHFECVGTFCNDFSIKSWGENYGHTYYYGVRRDPIRKWKTTFLILNQQVYAGILVEIAGADAYTVLIDSGWILTDLEEEKAIFKKFRNLTFEKYKNYEKPYYLSEDGKYLADFELKTCELPLKKSF